MNRLRLVVLILVLASVATLGQERKVPKGWDAKTIQWQTTDSDGTKWAVLEGKDDVPGQAFTYAAFIPAGYHSQHAHSSDARVAVVLGALKVGFGEKVDLNQLTSYPVGSFLFVPANVEHVMAADVDTILIGTAVGPWVTTHHHQAGEDVQHHH
jgi:quercetin dioxygenase-like cupin family protein